MGVYGEVLYRHGWWVKRCATEDDAAAWCRSRIEADRDSTNPPRDVRVRPAPVVVPVLGKHE